MIAAMVPSGISSLLRRAAPKWPSWSSKLGVRPLTPTTPQLQDGRDRRSSRASEVAERIDEACFLPGFVTPTPPSRTRMPRVGPPGLPPRHSPRRRTPPSRSIVRANSGKRVASSAAASERKKDKAPTQQPLAQCGRSPVSSSVCSTSTPSSERSSEITMNPEGTPYPTIMYFSDSDLRCGKIRPRPTPLQSCHVRT